MLIQAIIFDLDGTITYPLLDFNKIKRELKIDSSPVWEKIQSLPPDKRARAENILIKHEIEAAKNAKFNVGVMETFAELDKMGIKKAVLTRNCKSAWEIVKDKLNLVVEEAITREDNIPIKPAPDGVIELMNRLNVSANRTLLVGDYLFDIQAGRNAGVRTVLFVNHSAPPEYAHLADFTITDMRELVDIVTHLSA